MEREQLTTSSREGYFKRRHLSWDLERWKESATSQVKEFHRQGRQTQRCQHRNSLGRRWLRQKEQGQGGSVQFPELSKARSAGDNLWGHWSQEPRLAVAWGEANEMSSWTLFYSPEKCPLKNRSISSELSPGVGNDDMKRTWVISILNRLLTQLSSFELRLLERPCIEVYHSTSSTFYTNEVREKI